MIWKIDCRIAQMTEPAAPVWQGSRRKTTCNVNADQDREV